MGTILDSIYFDELYYLTQKIKSRKYTEWRMDLSIASNPHLDPKDQKELWESLRDPDDRLPTNEYDREGLMALKSLMAGGRGFSVK
jgi:hypothetical protein